MAKNIDAAVEASTHRLLNEMHVPKLIECDRCKDIFLDYECWVSFYDRDKNFCSEFCAIKFDKENKHDYIEEKEKKKSEKILLEKMEKILFVKLKYYSDVQEHINDAKKGLVKDNAQFYKGVCDGLNMAISTIHAELHCIKEN